MGASHAEESNVLETVRVREVVGVVTNQEALDRLVTDLTSAGFDRADIDLMASQDTVFQKLHDYVDPATAAEIPDVPRRELITRDDALTSSALVFGTLIAIGTLGAALPVVASGGALATAIAAAAGGGLVGTGIAKVIRDHIIDPDDAANLENELNMGGLIVFVRVRTPEAEATAQEIMLRSGARNVHVHEIELKKTLEDIPLAQIRPDPWLGNESLGT